MKVMITGSTNPLSIAHMWYEAHMGKTFEVEVDPDYEELYKTVSPIYKEHHGHIKKIDCIEVWDVLPQAIETNEPHSNVVAEAEEG